MLKSQAKDVELTGEIKYAARNGDSRHLAKLATTEA